MEGCYFARHDWPVTALQMTDDNFTDIGFGRCQQAAGENYVMKLAVNSSRSRALCSLWGGAKGRGGERLGRRERGGDEVRGLALGMSRLQR